MASPVLQRWHSSHLELHGHARTCDCSQVGIGDPLCRIVRFEWSSGQDPRWSRPRLRNHQKDLKDWDWLLSLPNCSATALWHHPLLTEDLAHRTVELLHGSSFPPLQRLPWLVEDALAIQWKYPEECHLYRPRLDRLADVQNQWWTCMTWSVITALFCGWLMRPRSL